jgi:isochorismate synthase
MNKTTTVLHPTFTETEYFSFLLNHAFENNFAVAVWKLPSSHAWHLLISRRQQFLKRETTLEDLPAGFIFAPFERSKDSLFLEADHIFSFSGGRLKSPQNPKEVDSLTWLHEALLNAPPRKKSYRPFASVFNRKPAIDQAAFEKMVEEGVHAIENGTLEKIVTSRTRYIQLPTEFDVVDSFHRLCATYPNALVSFVSAPETGSWLGASPETLVSVENQTIFKTVALAGTKMYEPGTNLKTVAWTQKEIEEQALVERYIISCFKKIRVREYDEHGPKTVVAGNLLHLKSDFMVDMKAINFPQLGSVMLQLLHPTSAVCGMPLEPALDFLRKHEGYEREYYAGFLGPVNVDNDIHIFVNLRCMKLMEGGALLYAGAGVTNDSVPENEWNETEMKLNTLLNVIDHIGKHQATQ